MRIEVVGKNGFQPSQANKNFIEKKLVKVEQFLDLQDDVIGRVVCKVYKTYHKVEITIPARGLILRAEVVDEDLYGAVDKAIDKLTSQIRKYKTKYYNKQAKESMKDLSDGYESEKGEVKTFVRDKQLELEPMTSEEAIDQMELLGHDFFIYLDKNTHKTNVIYLRKDGEYAIIETKQK